MRIEDQKRIEQEKGNQKQGMQNQRNQKPEMKKQEMQNQRNQKPEMKKQEMQNQRNQKPEMKKQGSRKRGEQKRIVAQELLVLSQNGRMRSSRDFCQHGNTSVYTHSVRVAYCSLRLAGWLHLLAHQRELVRGALLHDYFLYDWHEKDGGHRLHGFRHPRTALRNAGKDFQLSSREADIIKRHMFPLVPIPPVYPESWIVCLVDKGCSLYETVWGKMAGTKKSMR